MIKYHINDNIVEPVIVLGRNNFGQYRVQFADGAVLTVFESDIAQTRDQAELLCRIYRDDRRAGC